MRQLNYLSPTLRDIPTDAEVASHQLLLRAGFINQLASGIYTFLPLGLKVLHKVQNIIREEMDMSGAQEVLMPALHPAELWKESGRWDIYGAELMRLSDRHEREFALGATHEEVVTKLLQEVKSYKKLPISVYQIQTKFRDEKRPRFGLLRGREFIMKDAYSFDINQEGLDVSYQNMFDAYQRIFSRCGLNFKAVEADSGAIGGNGSHEFMVLTEIGEDTISFCNECGYASNVEKAEFKRVNNSQVTYTDYDRFSELNYKEIETPNIKTIKELSTFLGLTPDCIIKSLAFKTDLGPVLMLIRGDYEANEFKLKNVLGCQSITMMSDEEVRHVLGSVPGFLGPIGLPDSIKVLADFSVEEMTQAVIGSNKLNSHLKDVQPGRDFRVDGYYDLRNVVKGDCCPRCSATMDIAKGIEVGHVFKLGTKYSEALGTTFLDENGKEKAMVMGCYGIGISRTIAAIVEQNRDEQGIVWPLEVAPFSIHIIPVNTNDSIQMELSNNLYIQLRKMGYDVLLDDRNERAGVKFKDADLIGIPLRIIVGKGAVNGIVECKNRQSGAVEEVEALMIPDYVRQFFY